MPWRPLPRIAFAIAVYPFAPSAPADLPLELGDELYIIEEGGIDGAWLRGYLVAPPSLLSGLTSTKGQTLEARVFSGIFPRSCVEIREYIGGDTDGEADADAGGENGSTNTRDGPASSGPANAAVGTLDGDVFYSALRGAQIAPSAAAGEQQYANAHTNGTSSPPGGPQHAKTSSLSGPMTPTSLTPREGKMRPPAPVPMLKIGDETPTCANEPLVDEIASCLREWHSTNLHELLLSREYSKLAKLTRLMNRLDMARRQLLHGVLTAQEVEDLHETVVWDMVKGNKLVNNEIIIRDPKQRGRLLTANDDVIEITKLSASMALLDAPAKPASESINLHHLLVEVVDVTNNMRSTQPGLHVAIYRKVPGENPVRLTESFAAEAPQRDRKSANRLRTLFTDLTQMDVGELSGSDAELFVVIKVQATIEVRMAVPALQTPLRTTSSSQRSPSGSAAPSTSDQISSNSSEGANAKESGAGGSGGSGSVVGGAVGGFNRAGRRSLLWGANKLNSARKRMAPPAILEEPNSNAGQPQSQQSQQPSTQNQQNQQQSQQLEKETSPRPPTATNERDAANAPATQAPGQQSTAKRDIGVAVLRLKDFLSTSSDGHVEQTVTVYSPSENSSGRDPEHEDWTPVVGEIMKSVSGRFEECASVAQVQVRLQSFVAPDVDELIRTTPTALLNVHKTPKIGFPGAPKESRSDIYVTITEPLLPRNASFAHPHRGSVQLTESIDKQNLQLTLEVRKSSGERVEHCIFPTSNSAGVTAWRTTAIQRGGAWRQTIRLAIPSDEVPECHIIMSVADAPNFPFALAWMPLWAKGAFIEDGTHMPLLYIYDKFTSRQDQGRGAYLDMEWDSRPLSSTGTGNAGFGGIGGGGSASLLRIETFLCSTELTQDQVLLGLLSWRTLSAEQLSVILRQFPFVQDVEIIKLSIEVGTALFTILTERAGQEEFEDLILNNIVSLCAIARDRRFNKDEMILRYVNELFDYPHVALPLLRSLRRLFERTNDYQNSRHLNSTIKAGKRLMHMIVQSRKLALARQQASDVGAPANDPTGEQVFIGELQRVFHAFEALMRSPSPALIGSKALLMQNIGEWVSMLRQIMQARELWGMIASFVDSTNGVQGKLLLHRLSMILDFCRITLPATTSGRSCGDAIDQAIHDWIAPYWGATTEVNEQYREQVRLCTSIISLRGGSGSGNGGTGGNSASIFGAQQLNYLIKLLDSFICLRDAGRAAAISPAQRFAYSPLFPTSYPFATRPLRDEKPIDEGLLEITALLASFCDVPTDPTLFLFTPERIMITFDVLRSIVDGRAYPAQWLTLSLLHHRNCLLVVQRFFGVMQQHHLPEPEQPELFHTDLWKSLFKTVLTIVSSGNLALETFPEQKRRAVWKIAGDVREVGAGLLARCWNAIGWEVNAAERAQYGLERLGGWQVQYVPHLVGPVVELCLSVHAGLRATAVQMLQSMIISEWSISGDLAVIQHEIVDCLNQLLRQRHNGAAAEHAQQKLFVIELMDLFEPLAETNDNELWEAFKELIGVVEDLLDLLVVVHSPDTSDAFRTMNTLRLMDFLRDMQKEDIFIGYVHQLADAEAAARCFKEAGLAIRLHADLYDWDPARVAPALQNPPGFPEQSHFERRERLYFDMIRHFEDGGAYGSALDCYRELAQHYELTSFDFAKLARTQRSMAKCYDRIAKGEAAAPRYFKVVYKGLGFPNTLRDKQYIFEANATERLVAFTDRLQREHPTARIMASPNDQVQHHHHSHHHHGHHHPHHGDGEGQYLYVTPVAPYRDIKHPLYQRPKVSFAVKEYILSHAPVNFALTTKRHSPKTGVRDQWVEKTVYTTAEVFPTILRRSEVIAEEALPLSPLQTAIERTVRKSSELWTLEKRFRDGDESSHGALLDAMRSSVDPYSSNSVAQYRDMLPVPAADQRRSHVSTPSESELADHDAPKPASAEDQNQAALRIALFDFTYMLRHCFNSFGRQLPTAEYQKLLAQFQTTFGPELEHVGPTGNNSALGVGGAADGASLNPLGFSDPTFQLLPPTPTRELAAAAAVGTGTATQPSTSHSEAHDTVRDGGGLSSTTRVRATPDPGRSRGNRLSMLLKRKPSTANSSDAEPAGSIGAGFMRKIAGADDSAPPRSASQQSSGQASRLRSPKKMTARDDRPTGLGGVSEGEGEMGARLGGDGQVYTAIITGSSRHAASRSGSVRLRPTTAQSNGTTTTTGRRVAELRKGLAARRMESEADAASRAT